MKLRSKPVIYFIALILGGTLMAGCATKGMQRSVKTGASMKSVEDDYKQAVQQLDTTKASLADLVRSGQSDVKKAFEKYSDNVDKMDTLWKRLSGHSDSMKAQGKEYFAEWQKQGNSYTNPEIMALSEQRRSDLSGIFAEIAEASTGVKGAFKAYMSDITEIRTYLSTDLTPKGIEAITPICQRAGEDGDNLKQSISPVLTAIGKARNEFALGGTR